ncbi:uncharacterized protein AKAW2_20596A [Aspergillus luchuensis]|uniref:Uncharacterized protein n=2 Tax=Aspergillus kawachii TaxID=1069201 RepID=A0A7R7W3K6_ASPKA|nr:uncharacterized protein AKAW2_20596A [Aspergillus luchuensis]BCR95656.1 hypothetical protein AKAW2_20596A [Aspergillus luchuensis]BCS08194.1 hypothetical protein ALUC_20564A [Aspergillus luchuensis]GAA88627.1 similar to An01g04660 [Aspergillus luchuensis IFO 4308]
MSSASSPAGSSSDAETMKELLDRGEVKASWRDKQFVHFLDLKEEYGREFLGLVKDHVEHSGWEWTEILNSSDERDNCAKSFVEEYGLKYWGTPANRKKYLQEESLADEKTLCTYPAQSEEIARTIAILLLRKAKHYSRLSQEKAKPILSTKTPFEMASTKKRKSTVKETDEDDTDKPAYKARARSTPSTIRPFKAIVSDSEPEIETQNNPAKKSKKQRTSLATRYRGTPEVQLKPPKGKDSISAPVQGTFVHRAAPQYTKDTKSLTTESNSNHINMPDAAPQCPQAKNTKSPTTESNNQTNMTTSEYAKDTKFLVTASNQVGMAPVWLPFTDFAAQATDFLEHMAEQCNVMEWSPSAQLKWDSMSPQVFAASVRFDWSDFEIRVRRECNEDLLIMLQELDNAWQAEADAQDEASVFKIRVMLHVGTS